MENLLERLRKSLGPEDEPSERIDPRALKVWQISGLIKGSIFLLMSVIILILGIVGYDIPVLLGWVMVVLALIYLPWGALIAPMIRYHIWRYEIRQDEIDIQHGIFIIRRNLIPMVKVQHVDTEHGPLMRHFGLATLRVSTAATSFHVPALTLERAAELRRRISTLARVSDEDV